MEDSVLKEREAAGGREGLMYDPGLIECAEFDWFSV